MAKKARVYDGTAWQELASAQTDLTAYSTTAQMNTAITAGVGLVPILKQTIGTAVSSITVNNAFSATYDSYRILLIGGSTTNSGDILLKLGATTSGYKDGLIYIAYSSNAVAGLANTNASSFGRFGGTYASGHGTGYCELDAPFLTQQTYLRGVWLQDTYTGSYGGVLANTTSYTDFTLTLNTGTITGGTVYVYGYKK